MHQADLPVTPRFTPDMDPAVPPDGKEATFASDQDGDDFKIYAAKEFTGEVQRVIDNAMDDLWQEYYLRSRVPTKQSEDRKAVAPFTQGPVLWLPTSCVDRPFSSPK